MSDLFYRAILAQPILFSFTPKEVRIIADLQRGRGINEICAEHHIGREKLASIRERANIPLTPGGDGATI
jgi:hypothetical protein